MKEFFASGGSTKFIDRLASTLGIHASTIKMVSVYEGSVVLNYAIVSPSNNVEELEKINQKQIEKFASGQMDLGAPLLDVQITKTFSTETKSIPVIKRGVVTAAGYQPVVITKVSGDENVSRGEFVPDIPILRINKTIYESVTIKQEKEME